MAGGTLQKYRFYFNRHHKKTSSRNKVEDQKIFEDFLELLGMLAGMAECEISSSLDRGSSSRM